MLQLASEMTAKAGTHCAVRKWPGKQPTLFFAKSCGCCSGVVEAFLLTCGQVASEDVGDLPAKIELDVLLCWEQETQLSQCVSLDASSLMLCLQKRTAVLRHRILPQDSELAPLSDLVPAASAAVCQSQGWRPAGARPGGDYLFMWCWQHVNARLGVRRVAMVALSQGMHDVNRILHS